MPNYTRQPAKEVQLPARLPLVGVPNQRGASTLTDSRLINAYVEIGQDEIVRVVKRCGMSIAFTHPGYAAGAFDDLAFFYETNESPGYTGKLYKAGVQVATLGSYAAPISAPPARWFSIHKVYSGISTSVYFIHDGYSAWTFDGTTLKSIPLNGATLTLTCGTTNTSKTVTTASTASLSLYTTVAGAGIPAGAFVESIVSTTDFTISASATATAASVSLNFVRAGPGNTLSGTNKLVPGVSDLNGSTYLLTTTSQVQGSDSFTPYAWNPLNFVYAYANQDVPRAISKQLSYLVVFKSESTEFFRDVGSSPGSPLERLEGMRLDIGCFAARTIASIDGSLLWASYTESGLKSVYMLAGLKHEEIATPAVRRVLEGMTPTYAISFSVSGHSFYVLTDPTAGISLVYDITSKFWSYWNALTVSYFPFAYATVYNGVTYLQHESDGNVYQLEASLTADTINPIVMEIYPPQYDAGMRVVKYCNRLYIIADQPSSGILEVRVNDDDQKAGSWTPWRPFDLTHPRPAIYNCGSFTKRWFHFRHASNFPCRLTAVELDLVPGVI